MSKKVLALIIVVAMMLTLITACKTKSPSAGTSATVKPGTTTAKPSGTATTATKAPSATASTGTSATVAPSGAAPATEAPTQAPVLPTAPEYIPTAPPVIVNPSEEPTTPPDWTRPPERAINLGARIVEVRGHYATIDAYATADTGDPNNAIDKRNALMRSIQTQYNFTFTWIRFVSSGWRVTVNFNEVAMAGGDWADIVWVQYRYAFPVQVVRNLVKPLDTLFDFVNDPVFNVRFMRTGALWKGRVYGLQSWPYGMPDLGIFYRRDIIAAAGLPDPLALYNEGNWTWENFFNEAVQLTRDFNNDGVIDQYGLNGDVYRIYSALLYSNGGRIVAYDPSTQQFNLAFERPAAMKVLLKINEIVNTMKIVPMETFMQSELDGHFTAGTAVFLFAGLPGHFTGNANILWMALPRGPDYSGTMGFIREINYWAFTSTIGTDWQDVITATSAFWTRGYDYIRYPELDKNVIWDSVAYMNAIRPSFPGTGDAEHIVSLMFTEGTEVLDSPAWKNLLYIITDNIVKAIIISGVPTITAIDMYRDQILAQLNSELAL